MVGRRYEKGTFLEGEVVVLVLLDQQIEVKELGFWAHELFLISQVSKAIPGVEWEVRSWCFRQLS